MIQIEGLAPAHSILAEAYLIIAATKETIDGILVEATFHINRQTVLTFYTTRTIVQGPEALPCIITKTGTIKNTPEPQYTLQGILL